MRAHFSESQDYLTFTQIRTVAASGQRDGSAVRFATDSANSLSVKRTIAYYIAPTRRECNTRECADMVCPEPVYLITSARDLVYWAVRFNALWGDLGGLELWQELGRN